MIDKRGQINSYYIESTTISKGLEGTEFDCNESWMAVPDNSKLTLNGERGELTRLDGSALVFTPIFTKLITGLMDFSKTSRTTLIYELGNEDKKKVGDALATIPLGAGTFIDWLQKGGVPIAVSDNLYMQNRTWTMFRTYATWWLDGRQSPNTQGTETYYEKYWKK